MTADPRGVLGAAALLAAVVATLAVGPPAGRAESTPPGVQELWQQYPLETAPTAPGPGGDRGRKGAGRSGTTVTGPGRAADASAAAGAAVRGPGAADRAAEAVGAGRRTEDSRSLPWAIALLAIAAVVLGTATTASRFLARRRPPRGSRGAGERGGGAPPGGVARAVDAAVPQHCTIRLERAPRGGARFVARIEPFHGRPAVVARSRTFPWSRPDRVREEGRAARAHFDLLFALHNQRWSPVDARSLLYRQAELGTGRLWFERRFARSADDEWGADR